MVAIIDDLLKHITIITYVCWDIAKEVDYV